MEIVPLNALTEGIYIGLQWMIEVIVLITVLVVIAGFTIYLVGTAWLCFEETRRRMASTPAARRSSPPVLGRNRQVYLTSKDIRLWNQAARRCARPRQSPVHVSSSGGFNAFSRGIEGGFE